MNIEKTLEKMPKSLAAYRASQAKIWAWEVIEGYAFWLAPVGIEKGNDDNLARLISEARAPGFGK